MTPSSDRPSHDRLAEAIPTARHDEIAIDLWHASASEHEPAEVERHCEQWLDDGDRDRARLLKRATSRNQHVVGRGMVRRLLSGNGVEPQGIRFAAQTHGRPYIASPPQACRPFNVSHTSGLVLTGLLACNQLLSTETSDATAMHETSLVIDESTGDGLIGVDVEKLDRRTDISLAERYFSKPEVEYVRAYNHADDQRAAFIRIWTLKESFIKAIGTGLNTPLAHFCFRDIDSDSPTIEMLDSKLESSVTWRFSTLTPRPGYIASVAIGCTSPRPQLVLHISSFDDFILGQSGNSGSSV